MHGWKSCDTARCERCSVYTPTADLVFSSGRAYCTDCGAPPAPARAAAFEEMEWPATGLQRLEHPARVAAVVMLAITLCFPLAACVSQL